MQAAEKLNTQPCQGFWIGRGFAAAASSWAVFSSFSLLAASWLALQMLSDALAEASSLELSASWVSVVFRCLCLEFLALSLINLDSHSDCRLPVCLPLGFFELQITIARDHFCITLWESPDTSRNIKALAVANIAAANWGAGASKSKFYRAGGLRVMSRLDRICHTVLSSSV